MPMRASTAFWEGDLLNGAGLLTVGDSHYTASYTFASRFESGTGTNPEELLGAAHAACFSMALSGALTKLGKVPKLVDTRAEVKLEESGGMFSVTRIDLHCQAAVPGIASEEFLHIAEQVRGDCPISRALASVDIRLIAKLV